MRRFTMGAACLVSPNHDQLIYIQGTEHVGTPEFYNSLQTSINGLSALDFTIVHEGVSIPEENEIIHAPQKTQDTLASLWEIVSGYESTKEERGGKLEGKTLKFPDTALTIDVNGIQYAEKLAAAGYEPDLRLMRFMKTLAATDSFDHDAGYWQQIIESVNSQDEFKERIDKLFNLKHYPLAMDWRNNKIIDQTLITMAEEKISKIGMFYGRDHVPGFTLILCNRNWRMCIW